MSLPFSWENTSKWFTPGTHAILGASTYSEMASPRDLYIITTAKKRDDHEWLDECSRFLIGPDRETSHSGVKVTVDSWNNIQKYKKVYGAFFIFDEQRLVGSGPWVKAFLDISRKNQWVLLTATPGDVWKDYIPVFVANGFYRNRTEFMQQHAIYAPWVKFTKIIGYRDKGRLISYRNRLQVHMKKKVEKLKCEETKIVAYNKPLYLKVWRDRQNPFDNNCPIEDTGTLFFLLRKVVNSDSSRVKATMSILEECKKAIIFYNHDYELDILKQMCKSMKMPYSEWNGHKHESLLTGDRWVYLVNYAAGSEGWNCVTTDTIIFYSLNYSYRTMVQAAGRIDRRDSPYENLFYYYIRSSAPIDLAIHRALDAKANFNEKEFLGK